MYVYIYIYVYNMIYNIFGYIRIFSSPAKLQFYLLPNLVMLRQAFNVWRLEHFSKLTSLLPKIGKQPRSCKGTGMHQCII